MWLTLEMTEHLFLDEFEKSLFRAEWEWEELSFQSSQGPLAHSEWKAR